MNSSIPIALSLLLLNVAVASVLICVTTLFTCYLAARRSQAWQRSIVSAGGILLLIVPVSLWFVAKNGVSLATIYVSAVESQDVFSQSSDSSSTELETRSQTEDANSPVVRQSTTDTSRSASLANAADAGNDLLVTRVKGARDQVAESSEATGTKPGWTLQTPWLIPLYMIWLSGTVFLSIRLIHGVLLLLRLRQGLRPCSTRICSLADSIQQGLGLTNSLQVFESQHVSEPMVIGIWRPIIVVPCELLKAISEDELRAVLAHEAAHVLRWDCLQCLLQRFAVVVFWWNPLVHWMNGLANHLRELDCDDIVVRLTGTGLHLAESLVIAAETCLGRRTALPGAVGFLDEHKRLVERVERLTNAGTRRDFGNRRAQQWLASGYFLTALAVCSVPVLRAVEIPVVFRGLDLFRGGRFQVAPIISAVGGDQTAILAMNQTVTPVQRDRPLKVDSEWVAFRSIEDRTGPAPRLQFTIDGVDREIACSADSVVISYLADKSWGKLPRLALTRRDKSRTLLRFPLQSLTDKGRIEKVVLKLTTGESQQPLTEPMLLDVFAVSEPWDDAKVTWDNQPPVSGKLLTQFTVAPTSVAIEVDLTDAIRAAILQGVRELNLLIKESYKNTADLTNVTPDDSVKDWLAVESLESRTGSGPWIDFTHGEQSNRVSCLGDSTLISYLPDSASGHMPILAISRSGSNRAVLVFPKEQLFKKEKGDRAILHLAVATSTHPITEPLTLLVHRLEMGWTSEASTWKSIPIPAVEHSVEITVQPVEKELTIDVTELLPNEASSKGDLVLHIMSSALLKRSEARNIAPLGNSHMSSQPPNVPQPPVETEFERLPWPHQHPDDAQTVKKMIDDLWVINDSPLYQADSEGKWRYFHGGLDIVLPNKTPIYAMKDGWVRSTNHETVTVADTAGEEPAFGWEYTHISEITVQPGQKVSRGERLGVVNFRGLSHLHLTKVYSQEPWWGQWTWVCYPNAHFDYVDTKAPIIETPFHFFRNHSDDKLNEREGAEPVLHGDVDIVVPMRETGEYAVSRDHGFGGRLAVTRIEYEIRSLETGRAHAFLSFDFRQMRYLKGYMGRDYGTELTRHVFKHWRLMETEEDRRKRTNGELSSFYVITNSPSDAPIGILTPATPDYSWSTAATDKDGSPLFPNGRYQLSVKAFDFRGHSSEQSVTVRVRN